MQAFYSWKENEIEKIKQLKLAAEQEYLDRKIEQDIRQSNNDTSNQLQALGSIKQEMQEHQRQELDINNDLKAWLVEQEKNVLSPLNREVENAKRKLINEANARAEISKKIAKVHDQVLSTGIDALLKDSDS
ncbi:MAG: hypothetical protein O7D86_09865 [Proteobacteria bacterium]|nr:hypothetical protein [Pseudomonadota bacterium]